MYNCQIVVVIFQNIKISPQRHLFLCGFRGKIKIYRYLCVCVGGNIRCICQEHCLLGLLLHFTELLNTSSRYIPSEKPNNYNMSCCLINGIKCDSFLSGYVVPKEIMSTL